MKGANCPGGMDGLTLIIEKIHIKNYLATKDRSISLLFEPKSLFLKQNKKYFNLIFVATEHFILLISYFTHESGSTSSTTTHHWGGERFESLLKTMF